MKKSVWLIFGLFFLIAIEILKVYFIMPFPGSQQTQSISFAYFLHNNIWWLRIAGIVIIVGPLLNSLSKGRIWQKTLLVLIILLYGFVYYLFNFRFLADKIFKQPQQKLFVPAPSDTTQKDKLILGVVINNQARAYPIDIIGYHHHIKDTLAKQTILVTYCTVCRTGRVFSPFVNGKEESFRLVGMDHFNAMLEDATTQSWWQQATGLAISGKRKGQQLTELPSAQMSLRDWLILYPQSEIMQPDTLFRKQYAELKGYDEGTIKGKLERRDSASWQFKSWVIGISVNKQDKAYDWNTLVKQKLIEDSIQGVPMLITIEDNHKTFYALNRKLNNRNFNFIQSSTAGQLEDLQTHSIWKPNGTCLSGPMAGQRLQPVQAYQEFWHSWKQFHPNTIVHKN
jgi:hypothetical protein